VEEREGEKEERGGEGGVREGVASWLWGMDAPAYQHTVRYLQVESVPVLQYAWLLLGLIKIIIIIIILTRGAWQSQT